MLSGRSLLLVSAALVGIAGALLRSPWPTVVGSIVALGALGVHPLLTNPHVPRWTRLLLRVGLVLLAAGIVVQMRLWSATPSDPTSLSSAELITLANDPARQQAYFLRQLTVACSQVAACVSIGVAVVRLPWQRLVNSGIALVAVLGAMGLAVTAARTVEDAWRSRPEPAVSAPEGFVQMGVGFLVESGPDVETAASLGTLLLVTVVTVLACSRLSRMDEAER